MCIDNEYKRLLHSIFSYGTLKDSALHIFGAVINIDLRKGFPMLTIQAIDFRQVVLHFLSLKQCKIGCNEVDGMRYNFYTQDTKLFCQVSCSDIDAYSGIPTVVVLTALLTFTLAQKMDLEVGSFRINVGNVYIPTVHCGKAFLLLHRTPHPILPTVEIKKRPKNVWDVQLKNYKTYYCK